MEGRVGGREKDMDLFNCCHKRENHTVRVFPHTLRNSVLAFSFNSDFRVATGHVKD